MGRGVCEGGTDADVGTDARQGGAGASAVAGGAPHPNVAPDGDAPTGTDVWETAGIPSDAAPKA